MGHLVKQRASSCFMLHAIFYWFSLILHTFIKVTNFYILQMLLYALTFKIFELKLRGCTESWKLGPSPFSSEYVL